MENFFLHLCLCSMFPVSAMFIFIIMFYSCGGVSSSAACLICSFNCMRCSAFNSSDNNVCYCNVRYLCTVFYFKEIEPDSLEASDIESSKLSNNSTVYEDSLMSDVSSSSLHATQDVTKDGDGE